MFKADTRPDAVERLYQEAAEKTAECKEDEAFVVIPLTRSINPATRRYLDVESETKRILMEYNQTVRGGQLPGTFIHRPVASLPAGGEEALLLPPPNGHRRKPLFEEVSVDVSGSNFDRMAELRRKWQDGSKSGDDTWSSSEGTSRPGTGNPFTDDDDN